MQIIGISPYLSTLPLAFPAADALNDGRFSLEEASLRQLSDRMVEGSLFAAPVTTLTYLAHRDALELVPNLSVSSWGLGGSLVLASRGPLPVPEDCPILARDGYGVDLVRWLLGEMFALTPGIVYDTEPGPLMTRARAALLFGDEALISAQDPELSLWDLGEAWWQITQTPLVYMVWTMQRSAEPEAKRRCQEFLARVKAAGLSDREALLNVAQSRCSLSRSVLDGYFHRFSYDLTSAHERGMELLAQYLVRV